ncbi:MAG: VTT domain-containing protein [Candidatus Aminicenantaceae bacterium]
MVIGRQKKYSPKLKTFIFIFEILFIVVLLVIWFSLKSFQRSKSLLVLFFYSFPAEFLIAIVPHEPVILYFSKFYAPIMVALIAGIATILTESINYSVVKFVTDTNLYRKFSQRKSVSKIISLFNKAPFPALVIAGFTPVPFYPFRFLVVMAHYPLLKYLFAIFLSRIPRFLILSIIGHSIILSNWMLIVLFALLVSVNIPFLRLFFKKNKNDKIEGDLKSQI